MSATSGGLDDAISMKSLRRRKVHNRHRSVPIGDVMRYSERLPPQLAALFKKVTFERMVEKKDITVQSL
jgi:hypothetical protein